MSFGEDIARNLETIREERERRYVAAHLLLDVLGTKYKESGVVCEVEIHKGHDVHAFYRLSERAERVIHVQAYPGLSTDSELLIATQILSHGRMMSLRAAGKCSIGNEHDAVIKNQRQTSNMRVPYAVEELETKLAEIYGLHT
ncbi:hypothetical protein COV18_00835 [Candidatus Woesearchaeota archaeon CG10_big_fil_rev_8_21_14_0_10_37_12]|nr:MAG: hypothetical protein COV18_00835 [Candidatus Woesearchaeota archaeon CG10_big_fil_rev_8_21_14_0_10_37_12]